MKVNWAQFRWRLVNGLVALSLLFCFLTMVGWWRSYFADEEFEAIRYPHHVDTVEFTGGVLQITLRVEPTDRPPLHLRLFHTYTGEAAYGGWGPTFLIVGPIPYNGWIQWTRIRVPFWAIFLFFALTPFGWFVYRVGTQNRGRPGFCSQCGYDLRASTERCPECGTLMALPLPNS